jgi:hypothetical protein
MNGHPSRFTLPTLARQVEVLVVHPRFSSILSLGILLSFHVFLTW